MLEDSNELVFAEEGQIFTVEEPAKDESEKWKLLVVDDEREVHSVTKMVLSKFEFEGKRIEFLSAFSGAEARDILRNNNDIALILLDVVMEEDDSGLKMIKYIREELKNGLVRIVLRTGQPGHAPEEKVITEYDINDYKEKTELTYQKLYTTIVSSLRAYRDLRTIDTNRKGLRGIIDSFSDIFFEQPLKDFAEKVLSQLSWIIETCKCGGVNNSSFDAIRKDDDFYILASTGRYLSSEGVNLRNAVNKDILQHLQSVYNRKQILNINGLLIIYIKGMMGTESLILFEGCSHLNDLAMDLIEVFSSNVSAVNEAIITYNKYESEKQQRLLSEKMREMVMDLTSTLNISEVMAKLLENISYVVRYDKGVVLLKEDTGFKISMIKENGQFAVSDYFLEPYEHEVVSRAAKKGSHLVIQDTRKEMAEQHVSYKSCMAIPITQLDEIFGVMLLECVEPNAFSSRDEDISLIYAGQAGMAVENATLFSKAVGRNRDIRNILDNAGQGVLTFGSDLRIDEEYSAECINIFSMNIGGMKFSRLIYKDIEQQQYLDIMLQKILDMNSDKMREIYLPLLPSIIEVNEKYVDIRYKIIENPDNSTNIFMVIFTNITDRVKLENNMEKEHNTLRMVVKAVTDYEELVRCVDNYLAFCREGIHDRISSKNNMESVVFELMRRVHTFKGTFSQLDMVNVAGMLDKLESWLLSLRKYDNESILNELNNNLKPDNMIAWLEADLDILRDVLGDNYLSHEKVIFVDQAKLVEIERKIVSLVPKPACEMLIKDMKRLRHKPFKELLKRYPDYVEKLAVRLGKQVRPLKITGGDFLIDISKYEDFTCSLVHVFGNAVIHGIEIPEERIKNKKPELANISCDICMEGNLIKILIADDGCGIDFKKLRTIALEQGLLDEQAVCSLPEEEIIPYIFKEYITTSIGTDEYSGRGVGLTAVLTEVNNMNGSVEVESKAGNGTRFRFTIPCVEQ